MGTKIRIYRGNHIGGCVAIISTLETSVCIDFGESLPGEIQLEQESFDWGTENVDAVFFTHYHGDHIGRFAEIPSSVKLYMGSVTRKILINIENYKENQHALQILSNDERIYPVHENEKIEIGDIKVTPYSVDHSAYDAYMYLIETPDKVILHTGDYRAHGYRGKALISVINKYIRCNGRRSVDILLTEGTLMNRQEEKCYTERDMQKEADDLFKEQRYVYLICSSTNIDSLASFYKAAEANGMDMYCSMYVYNQIRTFREVAGAKSSLYDFKHVYPLNFEKVLVKTGMTQEEYMRKRGFVLIVGVGEQYEGWMQRFADLKPTLIYSMWSGYLNPELNAYSPRLHALVKKHKTRYMHTSGHAVPKDIARVIEAVEPKEAIIPIHTENPKGFKNLDIRKELKDRVIILEGEIGIYGSET